MMNNRRNTHRQRSRAPSRSVGLLGLLLLALLLPTAATAQTPPKRIDPRNPDAGTLQMIAQHVLTGCKPGVGNLTGEIHPLGKLSTAGPVAWLLDRVRCDTTFGDASKQPRDLLLVRAVDGAIPPLDSAERIGASELGSVTEFVGAGDFNGDDRLDLAVRMEVYGDTSFGVLPYVISRLVVLWGQKDLRYSIMDTVQLSCDADSWSGPEAGIGADIDQDGVVDLLVRNHHGQALRGGEVVSVARMFVYRGGIAKQWGRGGVGRQADWRWWNPSVAGSIPESLPDADCDGWKDLVFYNNLASPGGSISICYGRPNAFPDTANIQTLTFTQLNGESSLLSDLTGDGIPELLVAATMNDRIYVFAGQQGQRLKEQYGNANDSIDRANRRSPTRPWGNLWLPHHLHDGWFQSEGINVIGDLDGNSIDELWSGSSPFLLGYRVEEKFDSLADLVYRWNSPADVAPLGRLSASTLPVLALGYGGGISYLRATTISETWGSEYRLPHEPGYRCQYAASAVQDLTPRLLNEDSWQLQVFPQPAHGHATIHWNTEQTADTLYLTIHDVLGRQVWQATIPQGQSSIEWNTANLVGGVYTITLGNAKHTTTITTLIQSH